MRKRRSIVYVRPGKDVTLYVPAETPPEVIDYLNQLKEDGTFSQGVMEMITQYVMQQVIPSNPLGRDDVAFNHLTALQDDSEYLSHSNRAEPAFSQFEEEDLRSAVPSRSLYSPTQDGAETAHQKLDLAQIFRQAQRNAGKMYLDSNR